jgi:hypothetical protein
MIDIIAGQTHGDGLGDEGVGLVGGGFWISRSCAGMIAEAGNSFVLFGLGGV